MLCISREVCSDGTTVVMTGHQILFTTHKHSMCLFCCTIKKKFCILPTQRIYVFCMVRSQRSSYLNIFLFAFLMEIQHEVETELLNTCLHELLIFNCVQKIAKSDN